MKRKNLKILINSLWLLLGIVSCSEQKIDSDSKQQFTTDVILEGFDYMVWIYTNESLIQSEREHPGMNICYYFFDSKKNYVVLDFYKKTFQVAPPYYTNQWEVRNDSLILFGHHFRIEKKENDTIFLSQTFGDTRVKSYLVDCGLPPKSLRPEKPKAKITNVDTISKVK